GEGACSRRADPRPGEAAPKIFATNAHFVNAAHWSASLAKREQAPSPQDLAASSRRANRLDQRLQ
ncbi:hypothetical protein, partial [Pseudomonas sp. Ant30-3]|uniref:hypothetical protein n=1 Tax=Pseudomonas sp. Ant30-3 TaxID=1488328 RepID=UPI001F2692FE